MAGSGEASLRPSRADLVAVALLVACVLGTYWPEATFQRAFFHLDLAMQNLPARAWGFEQIGRGSFPLWCPHYGSGMAFLAEGQTGIAYPPNYLLYTVLTPWRALTLAMLAHLLFTACSAYALCRRWASVSGSLLGAITWTLGGRALAHQLHTSFQEVVCWFPFVLWALDVFLTTGRRRLLALACLGVGMQALAGSHQMLLLSCGGYGGWLLGCMLLAPRRTPAFAAIGMALAVVGIPLLGGIQLWPTLEQVGLSVRQAGLADEQINWAVGTPQVAAHAFVPFLSGRVGSGNAWPNFVMPWTEAFLYQGAIAWPLAMVGILAAWRDEGRARAVALLAVLLAIGLMLGAGVLHPVGQAVQQLPIVGSLRNPLRWWMLVCLGVSGLAALGWDELILASRQRTRWLVLVAALGVGVVGAGGVGFLAYQPVLGWGGDAAPVAAEIQNSFLWQRLGETIVTDLRWWSVCLAISLLAVGLARRWAIVATGLLAVTLAVDLGREARLATPTIDPSFHDRPAMVDAAKAALGDTDAARIWLIAHPNLGSIPPLFHETLDAYRAVQPALFGERGLAWGLGAVPLDLPLESQRAAEFEARLANHPYLPQLWGVALAQTSGSGPIDPRLAAQAAPVGNGFVLHRTVQPSPFAYWCPQGDWVEPGAALERLATTPRDPRTVVVLEVGDGAASADDVPPALTGDNASVAGLAQWLGPNHFRVSVDAPAAGWLVVNESWHPGWSAVGPEDADVPLRRANHLMMAVDVPEAGPRTVDFYFRPANTVPSLVCTALGLLAVLGGLLRGGRGPVLAAGISPCRARWVVAAVVAVTLVTFAVSAAVQPAAWQRYFFTLPEVW